MEGILASRKIDIGSNLPFCKSFDPSLHAYKGLCYEEKRKTTSIIPEEF
jgi:hypothetical protein